MKKQFSVETNVPVPLDGDHLALNQPKYQRYPVEHLRVGDSFFAPNETPHSCTGYYYKARKLGLKNDQGKPHSYTRSYREEDGVHGTRVWRVE